MGLRAVGVRPGTWPYGSLLAQECSPVSKHQGWSTLGSQVQALLRHGLRPRGGYGLSNTPREQQ